MAIVIPLVLFGAYAEQCGEPPLFPRVCSYKNVDLLLLLSSNACAMPKCVEESDVGSLRSSPPSVDLYSLRQMIDHSDLLLVVGPLLSMILAATPEEGATGAPVSLAPFLVKLEEQSQLGF